jgi:hypothetical protein
VQVGANQVKVQLRKDQAFPQGVIQKYSLSSAAAKFGRSKEVDG